jgi:hypothetical protein
MEGAYRLTAKVKTEGLTTHEEIWLRQEQAVLISG